MPFSFCSKLLIFLICLTVIFSCRKNTGETPAPNLEKLVILPSNTVQTDTVLASAITTSGASATGIVSIKGNTKPSSYGFFYSSINMLPSWKDKVVVSKDTVSLKVPSKITAQLTALSPNTVYYLSAFAIFNKDTIYGESQKFTTKINPLIVAVQTNTINSITYTTATYSGSIVGLGTNLTEYGFVYSLNNNPTIADNKILIGSTPPASAPYNYQSAVTGLVNGTTYYVRTYANDNSGFVYGDIKTFKTLAYVLPVVQTGGVTNISYFTASAAGSISSQGAPNVTEYGFVYSTTNINPTISDSKIISGNAVGTVPASFTLNLTNLTNSTGYYLRAYATNLSGTAYGTTQRFATLDAKPVTNTTRAPYNESTKSISANAEIVSQGGSAVTRYGFVYGTSTLPTLADAVSDLGTSVSTAFPFAFNTNISFAGKPAGTYYVRSFASNANGTSYGTSIMNKVYFNPTVTTGPSTANSITLTGTINSGGSDQILEYGFIYILNSNAAFGFNYGDTGVTIVKGTVSSSVFPFSYQEDAVGSSTNTDYAFKSYVKTANGIVYGSISTFRKLSKD